MSWLLPVTKITLSAIIIWVVYEVSMRISARYAGLIASLPMVSLLAMTWMYIGIRDKGEWNEQSAHEAADKIANHAFSTFWYVIPSLPLLIVLPLLLKARVPFFAAIGASITVMAVCYLIMDWSLNRAGVDWK